MENSFKKVLFVWLFSVFICLGVWASLSYVLYHFISKL